MVKVYKEELYWTAGFQPVNFDGLKTRRPKYFAKNRQDFIDKVLIYNDVNDFLIST